MQLLSCFMRNKCFKIHCSIYFILLRMKPHPYWHIHLLTYIKFYGLNLETKSLALYVSPWS